MKDNFRHSRGNIAQSWRFQDCWVSLRAILAKFDYLESKTLPGVSAKDD